MQLPLILLFLQLWGNVEVSLSQNACPNLPVVPHAHVSAVTKKAVYQQGNIAHFVCETGYTSFPPTKYACTENGWSLISRGRCHLKPCVLPDDTPNGYYQIISGEEFVFGTTVQYFCNEGYHMVSKDDTRTCTLDKWTNHVPICEPLSCDPPPAVGGVIVKGLPDNDDPILPDRLLKFSCEGPGKYVNGSSVLRCGQDGQWNHPFPTCENETKQEEGCRLNCDSASGCGTLPHIADADTKGTPKSWYSNGESVEYMCQNFYTMDGKPQQTCIDGKWTGQMRCLKPCTVDRELMNRYNLAFRYGYQDKLYSAHLDWIEFICTKGRRTGTLLMRQQCIDGVMDLPTCQ
ncbi:complement factor H-related protein 1 isoform X2 [Etheostoma spectabile]|uniref:complement factor H-related protein 1 isoform X2 n=1 Tax=Etheostoma spectabile TaxID=54343 RepID=UPI0013AF39C8|nr:complement factor H-related protein 1-like isoform X2 [Etheostoma spectabile]